MVGVQALIWYQNLRAEVLHLTPLLIIISAIVSIFKMIILILVVRFLV